MKVNIYPRVGVVSDPAFHSVIKLLLSEDCVNLANYITEAEGKKRATHENSPKIIWYKNK